ncbi:hypothetical protein SAMN00808754_1979 [Thermanaeromonas toyohensis ToBE]|uniref:Uncharacterized protein n=1 Tax=Thermanaeromonas toyohensis ToBE TaxID=698762 RepID=A0A1W1VWU9_9FIRM|nr:hypothetical protein [Thermanaeromonas toyohensis]SMB97837.1 hypothetical protein SAMN00808754_1979 [Thermanaeromonas toyohensis ToBE]
MADKFEVARDLVIALIQNNALRPTNTATSEALNASLVAEVAKAYTTIFQALSELEEAEKARKPQKPVKLT